MSDNIFLKNLEYYKRDIDPIIHYIEQSALYLSKMTGDPLEKCKRFVEDGIKNKKFPGIRNPTVRYYNRKENGDRELLVSSLSEYIKSTIREGYILAPTFTCYLHPNVKKSIIVEYQDINTKKRSISKKAAFVAEATGDMEEYTHLNNDQTNFKQQNNAVSGLFVATGSVLNNPSAHSTLTSTTRSVSSIANASNERIIGGNRHYHTPHIAINNIISIINNTDYNILNKVMINFNLVYPSIEDCMSCIQYSTRYYWEGDIWTHEILSLISKLTPIERAAFVYTGDLFHIRKLNDNFIREFLSKLSKKVKSTDIENPIEEVKNSLESIINLSHQICSEEVKGKGKDYKLMLEDGSIYYVLGTIKNVISVLNEYKDFIEAFFLTSNLPASIAYLPSMIRQGVVLSDTDSTCVSKDEWIKWYAGGIIFNSETRALDGAIMFIATESLVHNLAIFSSNINVAKDRLHTLAMKSEFYWDVFIPTNVAKHYYALTLIKEGNVFAKPKLEKKGVHLKNSKIPKRIINHVDELMMKVLTTISNNQRVNLLEYLNAVMDMETYIRNSILSGNLEFFKTIIINNPDAYIKDETESFYRHHIFWNEVFAPKYGDIENPPYIMAKLSTSLSNPTKLNKWLGSIGDLAFRERLQNWIIKNNKKDLPTIYLPINYLSTNGMIVEVKDVINTKRIILDLCNIYYILLETLSFYKKESLLVSDYFPKNT